MASTVRIASGFDVITISVKQYRDSEQYTVEQSSEYMTNHGPRVGGHARKLYLTEADARDAANKAFFSYLEKGWKRVSV
jgi:homoserine kinase